MMTASFFILGLSLLFMLVACVLLVKPWWVAAVPAFVALVLLQFTPFMAISLWEGGSWGVATGIVAALRRFQPAGEPDGNKVSNLYVGLSSLAGSVLGLTLGKEFILLGAIVGGFMGVMAYSRTPLGKWIKFPTSTFIQYFCAKGLPAIVATAMVGKCIEALIFYYKTCYFNL